MRLHIALVLVAACLGLPSGTLASGTAAGQVAQGTPTEGDSETARAPTGADIPFEDRVASFVTEFYLSGEARTDADLERLYAERVDYFGSRRWSRSRVLADKRAYFAKWPSRRYELVRPSLAVVRRPGPEKVYDVAFEYTFDVRSAARTSRGRGRALLTMDLSQDGGRITRETGDVLARW